MACYPSVRVNNTTNNITVCMLRYPIDARYPEKPDIARRFASIVWYGYIPVAINYK